MNPPSDEPPLSAKSKGTRIPTAVRTIATRKRRGSIIAITKVDEHRPRRGRSPSANNRCVRTSPARAWATIRFVNCLSSNREVLGEHRMWVGSAPSADHFRRLGDRVWRGVAGPGVAARPGAVPSLVVSRRRSPRRWGAGGDGGGGRYRLALRGRGDPRRRVRSALGGAGRHAGGAGPQAPRQNGTFRRPTAARVVAVRRSARVVDAAGGRVGVARTGPA